MAVVTGQLLVFYNNNNNNNNNKRKIKITHQKQYARFHD